MNDMTKQAEFCLMMAERLVKSVAIREEELTFHDPVNVQVGYAFGATTGAGKNQIKEDIKRLRRELQRLAEMVQEGG